MTATPQTVADELQGLLLPFCGTPWAATQGEEFSVPDPLEALSRHAGDFAWMLAVRDAYDPVTGETLDLLVSTHGYHSLGDGAGAEWGVPDWAHFPARLENPGTESQSIVRGGTIGQGSRPTFGSFVIVSPDPQFDRARRLRLRRREFDLWVTRASWMGPSFAELVHRRHGVIEDVTWGPERITLSTRDLAGAFAREVNRRTYLGFGPCVEMPTSGSPVVLDPGQYNPEEVMWRIMVKPYALENMVLLNYGGWEESSREGTEVRLTSDGGVLWVIDDYDLLLTTPSGLVQAGRSNRVTIEGGSGGCSIYVNGSLAAHDPTPYSRSVHIDQGTDNLIIGSRTPGTEK